MPRKYNDELRIKTRTITSADGESTTINVKNKTRSKQLELAQNYSKQFEQISFRADPGTRDRLSAWLRDMQAAHPDQPQYKSVNYFLKKMVNDAINNNGY